MAKMKKKDLIEQAVKKMENLNHLIAEGYPVVDPQGQSVVSFKLSEDRTKVIPIYQTAC